MAQVSLAWCFAKPGAGLLVGLLTVLRVDSSVIRGVRAYCRNYKSAECRGTRRYGLTLLLDPVY
jgi:hypothetical protein